MLGCSSKHDLSARGETLPPVDTRSGSSVNTRASSDWTMLHRSFCGVELIAELSRETKCHNVVMPVSAAVDTRETAVKLFCDGLRTCAGPWIQSWVLAFDLIHSRNFVMTLRSACKCDAD